MERVYEQASAAIDELFAAADTLKRGDILVIGCSTSEIVGKRIGLRAPPSRPRRR